VISIVRTQNTKYLLRESNSRLIILWGTRAKNWLYFFFVSPLSGNNLLDRKEFDLWDQGEIRQDRVGEKEVEEKPTKLEGRAGRDTLRSPLAITHGGGDGELTLSTSFHANDANVPAWTKSGFRGAFLMCASILYL